MTGVQTTKTVAAPVQCIEPMQSRRRSARIGGGSLPQEGCMGYATILGLDLGKFKSVCCVMNAASGEHRFETIDTTPAGYTAAGSPPYKSSRVCHSCSMPRISSAQ